MESYTFNEEEIPFSQETGQEQKSEKKYCKCRKCGFDCTSRRARQEKHDIPNSISLKA